MALALAEPKRVRKPLPFPPREPLPFPRPTPQTLPPAAETDDRVAGAFAAYWPELRHYGTHYLDLYGGADDPYADGEDIAAAAFLALVERSTDWQTGTHYVVAAAPAPVELLRRPLYQLAKVELRAANQERYARRHALGWAPLRIGETYRDSGKVKEEREECAPPLRLPTPERPAGSGWVMELPGVEALALGCPARVALAVLAEKHEQAARLLILRHLEEWSERDTAHACGVTLKALPGLLADARTRFARIYGRMVGCGCPTWASSAADGQYTAQRVSVATRAALRAFPREG